MSDPDAIGRRLNRLAGLQPRYHQGAVRPRVGRAGCVNATLYHAASKSRERHRGRLAMHASAAGAHAPPLDASRVRSVRWSELRHLQRHPLGVISNPLGPLLPEAELLVKQP
jgi:hypothetical protein